MSRSKRRSDLKNMLVLATRVLHGKQKAPADDADGRDLPHLNPEPIAPTSLGRGTPITFTWGSPARHGDPGGAEEPHTKLTQTPYRFFLGRLGSLGEAPTPPRLTLRRT